MKRIEIFTYHVDHDTPRLVGAKLTVEAELVVASAGVRGRRGVCLVVRRRSAH